MFHQFTLLLSVQVRFIFRIFKMHGFLGLDFYLNPNFLQKFCFYLKIFLWFHACSYNIFFTSFFTFAKKLNDRIFILFLLFITLNFKIYLFYFLPTKNFEQFEVRYFATHNNICVFDKIYIQNILLLFLYTQKNTKNLR